MSGTARSGRRRARVRPSHAPFPVASGAKQISAKKLWDDAALLRLRSNCSSLLGDGSAGCHPLESTLVRGRAAWPGVCPLPCAVCTDARAFSRLPPSATRRRPRGEPAPPLRRRAVGTRAGDDTPVLPGYRMRDPHSRPALLDHVQRGCRPARSAREPDDRGEAPVQGRPRRVPSPGRVRRALDVERRRFNRALNCP